MQLLCIFGKCKDSVYFQCLFQHACQFLQTTFQIFDFFRKYQSQMTALNHTVLYFRYIAKNFHTQLFFCQLLHPWVKHRRHLIKNHTFDMAVLFIFHKALNISSQRNTHSPAVHNKNHRCICRICQIIGTCFRGNTSHSIIKSHDTFHHCDIAVRSISPKKISGNIRICKKSIKIS